MPLAIWVHGLPEYLEGYGVLRPVYIEGLAREIMWEKLLEEFEEHGKADFSCAVSPPLEAGRRRPGTVRGGSPGR